jgi:hypothetical protein
LSQVDACQTCVSICGIEPASADQRVVGHQGFTEFAPAIQFLRCE